jgi:murein L,D-transpeptidase YafK
MINSGADNSAPFFIARGFLQRNIPSCNKPASTAVLTTHDIMMLRNLGLIMILILLCSLSVAGFLDEQMRYSRVRIAAAEKEAALNLRLKPRGLSLDSIHILLMAYKSEQVLELFVKHKNRSYYTLLSSYPVCATSGEAGPKKKQGDGQIPEGFYHISHFNPVSNFFLSLGINYPNAADRIRSKGLDPGGDIYIHGDCVTIGCLPMTDDKIKEIYLAAVHARNNGQQRIPVYIFPFRPGEANIKANRQTYASQPELIRFWDNLKTGYDRFLKTKTELTFKVDASGNYTF